MQLPLTLLCAASSKFVVGQTFGVLPKLPTFEARQSNTVFYFMYYRTLVDNIAVVFGERLICWNY